METESSRLLVFERLQKAIEDTVTVGQNLSRFASDTEEAEKL